MVKKLSFYLLIGACASLWGESIHSPQTRDPYDKSNDFLEKKVKEQDVAKPDYKDLTDRRERGRRRQVRESAEVEEGFNVSSGQDFEIDKVTNYKVLRDDNVVEIRNPKTGKRVITVMRATALPEEDLNRVDLEYSLMELDRLSIEVERHDEKPRSVRVGLNGTITYPLIGEIEVRGKPVSEVERIIQEKFTKFIHAPVVHVDVTEKSPRAKILVVGSGFREFQGHEKVLDILGADYKPSVDNIYDKVCVIRKYPDETFRCILIDMEYMFKYFDFEQNIPLKAGDIIQVRKMPPLFGYRFKFWWQQVLSWVNEIDEMASAVKSVYNFDLKDK